MDENQCGSQSSDVRCFGSTLYSKEDIHFLSKVNALIMSKHDNILAKTYILLVFFKI